MKITVTITIFIFFTNAFANTEKVSIVNLFKIKPISEYYGYCGIQNGKKTNINDINCGLIHNTLGISKYIRDVTDKQIVEEVYITGDDLTNHGSNIQFISSALINLSQTAIKEKEDGDNLKKYILNIISSNAFTKNREHVFKKTSLIKLNESQLRNYPKYAESKYRSYGILLAVLSAYPIIVDELSDQEIDMIKKWGGKIIDQNRNTPDGVEYNTNYGVPDAGDRVSINASTEILWGLTFSDEKIVINGISLYEKFIDGIKTNGEFSSYLMNWKGEQLRYLHHAYGGLTLGASYLKNNGIDAYLIKGKMGGNFKVGLEYFTNRLFDIKSRVDIGERQNTYFQNTNRTHVRTTWYFKAIKNDNVFDVDSQANNYLNSYLMTIDDE